VTKTRPATLVFLLVAGLAVLAFQPQAQAAACDALVGTWAWFTGGVATIAPDGTLEYANPDGSILNTGTWECTDAAQGRATLRWRLGPYVNQVVLSPDGQGLSSTDVTQWYVKATRVQQPPAQAASCNTMVGRWAWFTGGVATMHANGTLDYANPDGSIVNTGTWECTDVARGRATLRWRLGPYVNQVALSADGQGLSSTDVTQWYVTARRAAAAQSSDSAPSPAPGGRPPLARQDDCCQEAYGCETQRIEAEYAQKVAQCQGHPGNAACFQEAVSTKATQVQAAGEKLRLCHRAASGEVISPGPGTGSPASLPASGDEFHSTDRPGFFSPECVCTTVQGPEQTAGGGGDTFGSNTPGSDQRPPRGPGETFGSDSPGPDKGGSTPTPGPSPEAPANCTPDFYDRDVPGADDEWRYVLGFEQEVRRCLKAQVNAENLAVFAVASKVRQIGALLAIAAAPGAIDAVLHPPGSSPNPDPYLKGKEEAARLCEWALKVSPVVVARCPAKGTVRAIPAPRLPPRQTAAQLLSDLSWLRGINPTGNRNNCGNTVLAVEQALGGRGVPSAPPMSCGTPTTQIESLLGTNFGPISEAAQINNTIFHAGEGARGVVFARPPPGKNEGHFFNIVRHAGDVLLLDGQLGRQVSWAEYRQMGFTQFRLLQTN
jgi:hypothetical protein